MADTNTNNSTKQTETPVQKPKQESVPAPQAEKAAPKTLSNASVTDVLVKVPDVKIVGNGNLFEVLCKASSENEGWMKSTKAMTVPNGVVVQVSTQQRNPDGSYAVAEALTFVPCVCVHPDVNGGNKIGGF